jgi:hypothetical protein
MKGRVVGLVLATTLAHGQEAKWASGVYRVKAGSCHLGTDRVSTAFKVAGEIGLFCSLHGVIGCSVLEAASADPKGTVKGNLVVSRVNVGSDLAFLTAPAFASLRDFGFKIADSDQVTRGSQFSVPGYAYGLFSTVEFMLMATDSSKFEKLRSFVPPDIQSTYIKRTSPSIDAFGIALQGFSARGQSGAPILDGNSDVIAVVEGGAESESSSYVWGMALGKKSGEKLISEGPDWKTPEEAKVALSLIRDAPPVSDFYYSSSDKIAQELTLIEIEPAATGHLIKEPDWDLWVTVGNSPVFKMLNNHTRANNPLRGKIGPRRIDEEALKLSGAPVSSFLSCVAGAPINLTVMIHDNLTNLPFSGNGTAPCDPSGKPSNMSIIAKTSGIFKREKFVLRFVVTRLPTPE